MIPATLLDKIRALQGYPPLYKNEAGELPISRTIVSANEAGTKWLVEYKFSIVGGYEIHHVWEDM